MAMRRSFWIASRPPKSAPGCALMNASAKAPPKALWLLLEAVCQGRVMNHLEKLYWELRRRRDDVLVNYAAAPAQHAKGS